MELINRVKQPIATLLCCMAILGVIFFMFNVLNALNNRAEIAAYLGMDSILLEANCKAYKYDDSLDNEFYDLVCSYKMENAVEAKKIQENKKEIERLPENCIPSYMIVEGE